MEKCECVLYVCVCGTDTQAVKCEVSKDTAKQRPEGGTYRQTEAN